MWMTHRLITTALVALVALAVPAAADDKKEAPAASGTWIKKDAKLLVEFPEKGVMKVAPHGDKEFIVVCSYTIKDGVIKAKITDLEGSAEIKEKAKSHLPIGLEMSFSWKVKDESATLDDLKGENTELLKSHMEGEFTKKRSD
jgi:hypothetical protein